MTKQSDSEDSDTMDRRIMKLKSDEISIISNLDMMQQVRTIDKAVVIRKADK